MCWPIWQKQKKNTEFLFKKKKEEEEEEEETSQPMYTGSVQGLLLKSSKSTQSKIPEN